MVEARRRLLEKPKAEGKRCPGAARGAALTDLRESASLRGLSTTPGRGAIKVILSQKFRRERRRAREVVKRDVERLLAEHEEERRADLGYLYCRWINEKLLSGASDSECALSKDGSRPWSDV